MTAFIDANIFIYAAGREHTAKSACLRLLRDIGAARLEVVTDTEVLQEVLYRYWRIGAAPAGLQVFDHVLVVITTILPVDTTHLVLARRLLSEHPHIEPRDAVHAAVMLTHGLTHIYTYDRHFDTIPGITRLEP